MTDEQRILGRASAYLRLPGSPERAPEVTGAGDGLRCATTDVAYSYDDGYLDLLPEDEPRTVSQRALDTRFTAWLYDRIREPILRFAGMPDFATEVATIQDRLQVDPGDVVLDLACGQGNFTVEWARRAGDDGLVIGVDVSRAMLVRAARRVAASGLDNILLVRADAQRLPLAAASFDEVNCSGGFHAIPELTRAIGEIARVSRPDAVLTASTFMENPERPRARLRRWLRDRYGFHFVPPAWLGEQLAEVGYGDYRWSMPKRLFGYTSAVKAAEPRRADGVGDAK